jgi:hypothetical protein
MVALSNTAEQIPIFGGWQSGLDGLVEGLRDLFLPTIEVQQEVQVDPLAKYAYSDEDIRGVGIRVLTYLDPVMRPQNTSLGVAPYFPDTGGYGIMLYPRSSEFVDHRGSPVVNLNMDQIPEHVKVKFGGNRSLDFCFSIGAGDRKEAFTVRVLRPGHIDNR